MLYKYCMVLQSFDWFNKNETLVHMKVHVW
jgi:hypothetical protein